MTDKSVCSLCQRELNVASDPLSVDCGGDCWGCMGEIEADMGDRTSIRRVQAEIASGVRKDQGRNYDEEHQTWLD